MSTVGGRVSPRPGGGRDLEPASGRDAPPPASIGHALVASARSRPDELALVLPPDRLTYRQLYERAAATAADLEARGMSRGDHVGVLMPNCCEFIEHFFAMMLAGVTCVPLNARSEPPELARAIDHAGLRAIVTVLPVPPERDLVAVAEESIALAARVDASLIVARGQTPRGPRADVVPAASARDVAVLLYTSGTTSAPKGCLISHEAIVRTGIARLVERQAEPDIAVWTPCPLFHVGALVPLVGCVAMGVAYVTTRRFDAGDSLRLLEAERVTLALPLFPAFTDALLDHPDLRSVDLSHVRQFFASGPPRRLRRVQKQLAPAKLVTGYGMTEVCGVAASSQLSDTDQQRLDWDGSPFEGIDLKIVDPGTRRFVNAGVTGEIVVKGYCCFDGYHLDPEETRRAFDDDGWFHTGDMGRRDEEGRVAFLGRYKDMLKVGGENVAALEVETFLAHHEGVRRVEVVGAPDPRLEEVVVAFVELEPGAVVTAQDLIGSCAGRLARFKVPRHVVFVEAGTWPMSSTKVDKVELRRRIKQQLEEATA